jgi:S-DNA-T family DNA segregation ATPase FtsK/SpoIIIE
MLKRRVEPRAWRTLGGEVRNLTKAVLKSEHTLIAGTTGCGKSTLMNGLICDMLKYKSPSEAKLILIDPKRLELGYLKDLPHTIGYTNSTEGAVNLLEWAVNEMNRRYELTEKSSTITSERAWSGSQIYIIIDELHVLVMSKMRGEVWRLLSLLLTQGRASGIHVIAETQCPNRACLPNTVIPLFTTRIGMRCMSSIESRQVVGAKGCEDLPKNGLAIVQYEGKLQRVRIPMTNYNELRNLVSYWESDKCRA